MTISWHCILYLFGRELFECQKIIYSISNYKDLIWSLSSELLSSISFRSSRARTIWPPSLHLTDRGYSWNGQHPHRLQLEGLSQPLSACSVGSYTDGQVVQYIYWDRAERGWESPSNWRRWGGAVCSKSDIYSLGKPLMKVKQTFQEL